VACLILRYYRIFPIFFERYAILGFTLDLTIQWFNYSQFLRLGREWWALPVIIIQLGGWNLVLLIWLIGFLRNSPLPVRKPEEEFVDPWLRPSEDGVWIDPWEQVKVWVFSFPRTMRAAAALVY
jgi:hypothetical protein